MSAPKLQSFTLEFPGDADHPVRVAGDFSDPPWRPVELEAHVDSNGQRKYSKTLEAPEGQWQYKFCVGEERDWKCLDNAPKGQPSRGV